MLNVVTVFALAYSTVNWLLFVGLTRARHVRARKAEATENDRRLLDPDKLVSATGSLATAFKSAGAAATAAAMSLVGLVIAAVAAGIGRI